MSAFADDVMLLALDERRGIVPSSVRKRLDYALRGAVIMDLALRGRVRIEGRKVVVIDAAPTGDELLDEALAGLAGRRTRGIQYWVRWLPVRKLRARVLDRLVAAAVLRREPRPLLGDRYPVQDSVRRDEVAAGVREAVLGGMLDGGPSG